MKFIIKHEIRGRLRIHVVQRKMTCAEADILFWYLDRQSNITDVKVYERTADAVICYTGERAALIRLLKNFRYEDAAAPETIVRNSGRKLNASYKEKLIAKVLLHYGGRLLIPAPLRAGLVTIRSLRYLAAGLRCIRERKIEVPLLDATAIGVSVLRQDFNTAGSVMFLLGIGELLEEWTHKKSVGDLARSMSLNIKKVWLKRDGQEILVKADQIRKGTPLTFEVEGVLKSFPAVVYAVESQVENDTRKFPVRAIYPNTNNELMPGRYVNVRIRMAEIPDAIAVPSEALVPELGIDKVFLYKDGKAQPVAVETGLRTDAMVQVVKGLQMGDTVITSGTLQLRTDLPVKLDRID